MSTSIPTPVGTDLSVASPPSGRRLALGGVLTALAGLAVSELATAVMKERVSAPVAVGEWIVDVTPGGVARTAIDAVGTADKPLLLAGVTLGLIGFGALAGVLTRRSPLGGLMVFVAMAVIGAVAVLTRPGSTGSSIIPVACAAVTWIVLLPQVTAPPREGETSAEERRRFLRVAGLVAAGSVAVGVASRFVSRERRLIEAARTRLRLPVTAGTVPVGATIAEGLTPWRVPSSDFYRIDTALVVPTVRAEDWSLRIHGMVDREITLTYDDLVQRELTEAWVTLCCVSNKVGGDLIGNAWWSGVRVADLLAEAGVQEGADAVLQTSVDGWNCGTPLAALTDDRDALLAVAMNGEPLPLEHGFPVRMVVPGLYGFVSATKWVVDLEVTRFTDFEAFWTVRGWSPTGPVKTQSKIEVPGSGDRVGAGEVRVGGYAWAQHTGIEKVEIRLDGGPWTEVDLGRVPSDDTWVQWGGTVQAEPGTHTLAVRATDTSGYTQTGVRTDVVPDGATGWHTVEFTVT